MPKLFAALLALFLVPNAAAAQQAPGTVRVRIETSAGNIVLALDAKRAPKTTANFLAYVDDGRFDGTGFYRASRRTGSAGGFVQGGIASDARRILPSPPLEPTSMTGLRHIDGTISMAHGADVDSATGNFSIMVGPNPSLDARGTGRNGYAAFGRVIAGMDVVRKILARPTGGGRGPMRGQMIQPRPVTILRAVRLDGTPMPTGRVKPWLIGPTRWIQPN